MNSIWKFIVRDDTGFLEIVENKLKFIGRNNLIEINNVINVYITKQIPSYGSIFIVWLITIIFYGFTNLILFFSIQSFIIILIISIISIPIAIFAFRLKWIGLEYIENEETKKAFFTDGSLFGWKTALEGPGSLYYYLYSIMKY